MSFPHINLADLTRMQRDWAALLPENPWGFSLGGPDDGRLTELKTFGDNPGQLRLLHYVPAGLPSQAPLVVALHGCGQGAGAFDAACGWSTLADRHGFALLYPEQTRGNNAHGCFNWFEPEDVTRGHGETRSIQQMIAVMLDARRYDPARVFVMGFSAGGAMAGALLANHPELFAAGAIVAGLPFGAAADARHAMAAMAHAPLRTAVEWGDCVRSASPDATRRPLVAIWHGDADRTVAPGNAIELAKQWTDLHGLAETGWQRDQTDGATHRVWRDASGAACVELYTVQGLDHGVPIDGKAGGDQQAGHTDRYVMDAGVSAPWHMAAAWGLVPTEQ